MQDCRLHAKFMRFLNIANWKKDLYNIIQVVIILEVK